jgi:hypothetical protein
MRHSRTGPDARASRERQAGGLGHCAERKRVEFRCDLALESRLVVLARMLARPASIAAMPLADRLASRSVHSGSAARIIAS